MKQIKDNYIIKKFECLNLEDIRFKTFNESKWLFLQFKAEMIKLSIHSTVVNRINKNTLTASFRNYYNYLIDYIAGGGN